ncbi:MAG: serine/threonine-protein kinase [Gemmatimonadota bacterium]
MDIRPGTTLEGPNDTTITIGNVLGAGGFGMVFAGMTTDGTPVAVKTLRTSTLDATALIALQNEIQQSMGFVHPNVVRVLHVDDGRIVDNRPPYLVMELVDGGTLRDYLDDRQRLARALDAVELHALYTQITAGMQVISARLVHRDLKPANILVALDPVTLKIADFGLAKLADAATRSVTMKGVGTMAYLAPEAWDCAPNTTAMDVYAAGVLFFEIATLRLPIEPPPDGAQDALAWRRAHLLTAPRDLRALRPDLPITLVQLIVAMLQKDPRRRPSWDAVARALAAPAVTTTGRPDVSALLQRAVESSVRDTARETAAQSAREAAAERTALLQVAFDEVVSLADGIVTAFNDASTLATLYLHRSSRLNVEIEGGVRQRRITIQGEVIEDLALGLDGVARLLVTVALAPPPAVPQDRRPLDRTSFGSFNLVYCVRSSVERYGWWSQFRFETNPLTGQSSYPRWFAIPLDALPRELLLLNAIGLHQHERRELDDTWLQELIAQLL